MPPRPMGRRHRREVQAPRNLFDLVIRALGFDSSYDPRDYSETLEIRYKGILVDALSRSGLPLTVDELQAKLQSYGSLEAIHDDEAFRSDEGRAFLDRWLDRIKDLWNYTPRSELHGQRPTDRLQEVAQAGGTKEEMLACRVIVPTDFRII